MYNNKQGMESQYKVHAEGDTEFLIFYFATRLDAFKPHVKVKTGSSYFTFQ